MEMSAAAKSKKIRDYAAGILPALIQEWKAEKGASMDDMVAACWILAEKMYEMEVLTYDRVMKEAGSTRQSLAEEFSVIAARRGSTTDALPMSATVATERGLKAK